MPDPDAKQPGPSQESEAQKAYRAATGAYRGAPPPKFNFEKAAMEILHNLALERQRPSWGIISDRWYISDEPLRNDAANLLRRYGADFPMPDGTRYVGDDA